MTFSDQIMTLTLGQTFNMIFQGQMIVDFTHLKRRARCRQNERHTITESKVITEKTFFVKTVIFIIFALWKSNRLSLVKSVHSAHLSQRALKERSYALFCGALSVLVPELCADL